MSALACFWLETSGLTIFFSRPADLADLRILSPQVNWDQIRAQSVLGNYLCEETGLRGIYTLVSGDCIAIRSDRRTRDNYWSPASTGIDITVPNFDTAVDLLRSATRLVLNCWCALHKSIIISLSGGFDSSIVLSCVANAPSRPEVRAANLYSAGSADERRYARSIASKYGIPLVEVELPSDADLRSFLKCTRTANPVLHFGAFFTEPLFSRLCEQDGASSVFTGDLGDSLFGHGYGPELLAEAIWRYKLTARTLRTILDYAVLYRISVWRALILSLSEYRLYSRLSHQPTIHQRLKMGNDFQEHSLATDESLRLYEQMQNRFIHPWFLDAAKGPPGWLQTIPGMIMMTSTWTHSGFSDLGDSLFVAPLASQPLAEACLAIPADFHILRSESAAVARRSFGPLLSSAVLGRGKAKGDPDLWLRKVIATNRTFLKELLLDGILVKERILDRKKTEAALAGDLTRSKARVADIIVQLYIESWLRQWTDHRDSRTVLRLANG